MKNSTFKIFLMTLALLLLAGSAGAVPVEEWNMSYLRDVGSIDDIEQTSDGGYIAAAYDSIAKIDASGNKHWVRELFKPEPGFRGSTGISQVSQTGDGGYIIGGYRSFFSDSGSEQISLIVKTNLEGIEEWNRTFDENTDKFHYFDFIYQTHDGGYIFVESTTQGDINEVRVIKLDTGGNTTWMRTFENSLKPSLQQTPDGGYIVSFSRGKYEYRYQETTLQKLDSEGNDIWNRSFKGLENVQVELADRGFMISGELRSNITGADAFLIKTDPEGNELWNKTYGGTNDDGFEVIRKTQDGGYVLAGYTGGDQSTDMMNFNMGDAWLVKVGADGSKEWDMIFGELEMKSINSVRQTKDGGYLLAGRSGIKPQGSWVVKLSNDSALPNNPQAQQKEYEFSKIWTKLYDGGSEIYAMQQTGDGGIVLAGMNFDDYKAVLIKADSSGNELWNHTYKGGGDDRFYATQFHAVDETKDGGFILGGSAVYDIYARYDAWLVKTDSSGKEEWNRTIGGNNANEDISALLALDDGYILTTETWLIKTDNKGNQLWGKKYIHSGIRDIKRAKDDGYIIIASEDGSSRYTGDFIPTTGWILKTDESGNEKWKRSFGEYPRKMVTPNSVLQTGDGGYLVVGDYAGYDPSSYNTQSLDAWIIKFDKYGNEKWRRIIKNKSGPPPVPFNSFVDGIPSVVETKDGDYIIGGIINLYRTTGMDALIIKIDSNGTELWNMTAGGDGNQVVHSMQQTADGGLIFAGSMRNLDTEGHMAAMLMKVGKREGNNTKLDDGGRTVDNMNQIEAINNTGTNRPNESLPEIRNNTQKTAPSSGFYITVISFMILFLFKRRRR